MESETYVIVTWPESQDLMDEPWFREECHLINDDHGLDAYGSSAYFVPTKRLKKTRVRDEGGMGPNDPW